MLFRILILWLVFCAPLAQAATVTLLWDAAPGEVPQGFVVERKVGAGAYTELARPGAPPYTDSTVPTLTKTCWQVRAYNQLGVSAPSNEICLDLPKAPVNLTISTSGPTTTRTTTQTKVRKAPYKE